MREAKFHILIAAAEKDRQYTDQLTKHLKILQHNYSLQIHDHESDIAFDYTRTDYFEELQSADMALFVLSVDFVSTPILYPELIHEAIKLQNNSQLIVVGVLVRHFFWEATELSKCIILPENKRPVCDNTIWRNDDMAFTEIVDRIEQLIKEKITNNREYYIEKSELINELNFIKSIQDAQNHIEKKNWLPAKSRLEQALQLYKREYKPDKNWIDDNIKRINHKLQYEDILNKARQEFSNRNYNEATRFFSQADSIYSDSYTKQMIGICNTKSQKLQPAKKLVDRGQTQTQSNRSISYLRRINKFLSYFIFAVIGFALFYVISQFGDQKNNNNISQVIALSKAYRQKQQFVSLSLHTTYRDTLRKLIAEQTEPNNKKQIKNTIAELNSIYLKYQLHTADSLVAQNQYINAVSNLIETDTILFTDEQLINLQNGIVKIYKTMARATIASAEQYISVGSYVARKHNKLLANIKYLYQNLNTNSRDKQELNQLQEQIIDIYIAHLIKRSNFLVKQHKYFQAKKLLSETLKNNKELNKGQKHLINNQLDKIGQLMALINQFN